MAAGGGTGNLGTDYEQLVSKLMEANGDLTSNYWKHPCLLHTKEPLDKPLTTLPSDDLHNLAINMFKVTYISMIFAKLCQLIVLLAIKSLQ